MEIPRSSDSSSGILLAQIRTLSLNRGTEFDARIEATEAEVKARLAELHSDLEAYDATPRPLQFLGSVARMRRSWAAEE